jgi:hypothetical protein
MALTKLPKNAIGTGAIDASKIEDGTLQAVEISGTISSDKIATGTIANNKLINSTFTIRGTSRALGDSFSLGVNVDWQSVIVADGSTSTTGSAGKGYFINTTSAAHIFTLPASASRGDTIALKDYAGTFASNKLTINRNGHNIQGVANNSLIGTNRASLVLVYVDSTKGWLYAEEHNVADLTPAFISATGGTITTSGNFKIHTFTGDGCFVVTQIGSAPTNPLGGPSNVDYLVVAGGGGGGGGGPGGASQGGGGGGAGGYRTTFPSPGCNAGSFPISATTYPITVGGGGTGGGTAGPPGASPGVNGSPSIFSTITSAGGGGGGSSPNPNSSYSPVSVTVGSPGGSGGGAFTWGVPSATSTGGSGNTPPTSPSQGNNGGNALSPDGGCMAGGGGGGAGASGSPGIAGPSPSGGGGGNGLSNSISGSPITYAGGGGGNRNVFSPAPTNSTSPLGGTGGGGNAGLNFATNGTSGSNNTGGGGGGSNNNTVPGGGPVGGNGGKGIVIIRYKFQ